MLSFNKFGTVLLELSKKTLILSIFAVGAANPITGTELADQVADGNLSGLNLGSRQSEYWRADRLRPVRSRPGRVSPNQEFSEGEDGDDLESEVGSQPQFDLQGVDPLILRACVLAVVPGDQEVTAKDRPIIISALQLAIISKDLEIHSPFSIAPESLRNPEFVKTIKDKLDKIFMFMLIVIKQDQNATGELSPISKIIAEVNNLWAEILAPNLLTKVQQFFGQTPRLNNSQHHPSIFQGVENLSKFVRSETDTSRACLNYKVRDQLDPEKQAYNLGLLLENVFTPFAENAQLIIQSIVAEIQSGQIKKDALEFRQILAKSTLVQLLVFCIENDPEAIRQKASELKAIRFKRFALLGAALSAGAYAALFNYISSTQCACPDS